MKPVFSAVWIVIGLGFGGLVWAWAGGGTAQAYLAGYLIEKSLSVDNIVLFAAIFSAFAIPARYQHRVLIIGIIGALVMRAAFIAAGITLLEAIHPGTCAASPSWQGANGVVSGSPVTRKPVIDGVPQMWRCSGAGQGEGEACPFTGPAGGGECAAVRPRQLGRDGEADSAAGSMGGRPAAPEPVEDARQLVGWDADAGVGDLEDRAGAVLPGADRDGAAGGRELERVAEKVGGHLVHPPFIGEDECRGEMAVQRDLR